MELHRDMVLLRVGAMVGRDGASFLIQLNKRFRFAGAATYCPGCLRLLT